MEASTKETKRIERNAVKRKWYAELPQEKKDAILKKGRDAYAARKIRQRMNTPQLQIGAGQQPDTSNGLAHVPTGSSSVHPSEALDMSPNHHTDDPVLSTTTQENTTGSSSLHPSEAVNPSPFSKTTRENTTVSAGSKRDVLKCIATEPRLLPSVPECKYCHARRFHRETKGFCCSDGQVALVSNDIPDDLYDLYTSGADHASNFRTYVRTYNNTFAFTSFGVKYDKDLCKRNKGIYTFKVQGQVYHYINELTTTENPSYMQLYFYDTAYEFNTRMAASDKLQPAVVQKLIDILKINPYATFFRSLTNIPNLTIQEILIRNNPGLDQRVYNCPTSSQVAAIWLENSDSSLRKPRDIHVHNHAGYKHKVEYYYGCYDPLQYPLLFPYGESGWHEEIQKVDRRTQTLCDGEFLINPRDARSADEIIKKEEKILAAAKKKRNMVSCREYYCYRLQIRPNERSVLLRAGRLLQQYIVDMYVKLETSRLDYFRLNQHEIRLESYDSLVESIAHGETRGAKVGKRIILPSSFTGGPRDMRKRYMDAMTLVQKFGKPDIILTMTCNPNWSEIKSELQQGQQPQDRPDLVARVFRAKLESVKDDILKKEILGPIAAYTYVIEYQKRGLPHVHFLLIFGTNGKLLTPDSYDKIVSAELPDKDTYPHLYSMVVKHMMHGPCGVKNPNNICMLRDGKCKNRYPKHFSSTTIQGADSYPVYRRLNNGRTVKVRGSILDNRWVVPYNPYLLAKYNCHINVEICSSIKAVKYLYKYIYKGHDQIAFHVAEEKDPDNVNEIHQFQSARWVSAPEAMWRIYRFPMNEMHPAVQSLHLHLEGKQFVSFRKYDKLQNVIGFDRSSTTMLTEFFNFYQKNTTEPQYLYKHFPEHFVWDQQKKIWTKRKKKIVVGRIVAANPIEGERYYLRLLLNHIKGPASYNELLTFEGKKSNSFRESALLYGLLESDNNLEQCLQEATSYQMPETLRRLFATILVHCSPTDPKNLWETFEQALSEDYSKRRNHDSNINVQKQVLENINSKLQSMGKNITDYALTDKDKIYEKEPDSTKEIEEELSITITEHEINLPSTLNVQQKYAYDAITKTISTENPKAFFIDGPGGTGKTYLYCALLAAVRSKGQIALATATSGVAASLLPGGRTAHSRFKIPINIDENTTCNISKQTGLGRLIQAATLIIWDEAPMARRQLIEALDKMLQDINECSLPFGGKTIVFGGDFRQVLPVIPRATRDETIDATLIKSSLWPSLEKIKLTENMRTKSDAPFTNFLLRIGNGTEQTVSNGKILIPPHMLIPYTNETDAVKSLTEHVFPDLHQCYDKPELMKNRAILTPTNEYVDDINNLLIQNFPGDVTEYKSFDTTVDTSQQGEHLDFINSVAPRGLPPHRLMLKPNCPVILLRNLDPREGLSNGTRLICRKLTPNMIYAEIAAGSHEGKNIFLPRIPLKSDDIEKYPIPFERKQFPVRLCFAMTINKAQGQTLEYVGLYLPRPVFSHGQLYVALSRARTSHSIKVLMTPTDDDECNQNTTDNIVFQDLLALAD